ncbi:SusC/RagA family TonB-linked outer membrane protein [Chitinophagaceae bacterium MMS25-I14]
MKRKFTITSLWLAASMLTGGVLTVMAPLQLSAQTATAGVVSGVVTDEKGSPVPSATIGIKGTTTGMLTDADGRFSLVLPHGVSKGVLVIRSIGYNEQEVPFSGTSSLTVALKTKASELEGAVVIGYGTARKKDLTGSIATVSSKDFNQGVVSTPDQLIQGKAAGVVITPSSGQPGVGSTIRIRGGTSLTASNDPLIVIDGVPVSNVTIDGAPSPLSMINPDDIESFTILKDASAAAIYGNRASNGVIIIQTKRGTRSNKLHIDLSTTMSLAKNYNKVDVLTGDQVRFYVKNNGSADQIALLGNANTDWQKEIYQTAFATDNNIAFTGGIKQLPYRLSLGYLDQNGTLKTGYLKKTSIGLNLNPTFLDNRLKLDVNTKGVFAKNRFANTGAIGDALHMDPTQPVNNTSGKYAGYTEWETAGIPNVLSPRNPLGDLYGKNDVSNVDRFIGNAQLDYHTKAVPELRAVLNLGLDATKSSGNVDVDPQYALNYTTHGSHKSYEQNQRNKLLDFYLNYNKEVKSIKSRFDLTGGYSYQDFYKKAPANYTNGYTDSTYTTKDTIASSLRDETRYTLLSYYGRLNYTLANRYLLTASVRRDGSSRFAPNNRWGTFPALALAWKINEEKPFRKMKNLTELKLRASIGVTGNQDLGTNNYAYLPNYLLSTTQASYMFGDTAYKTYRAAAYDANIKWETTTTKNVALDWGFFNNRLYGTVEYYYKETDNLLNDIPTPAGANLSNHVITNVGSMEARGFEFSIGAVPVQTKDWTWTINYNLAYTKNKITKLNNVVDTSSAGVLTGAITGGTGNTIQINSVGSPANSFYAFHQVYNSKGDPIEGVYAEESTNGSMYYIYKSPAPVVTMGISSQVTYKRWNFGFSMHGSFGNYVYNNVKAYLGYQGSMLTPNGYIGNASTDLLYTNYVNAQYFSDRYIENASFMRMDYMTLGYNFGKIFKSDVGLRLNFMVQNAFVITKYSGLDPEIYSGIDNNIYPKPRVWSLRANFDF